MMSHQFLMMVAIQIILSSILPTINSQDVDTTVSFSTLPACNESSLTIAGYGADDVMEACLLYDVQDDDIKSSNNIAKTTEVALVQVTPSNCNNQR